MSFVPVPLPGQSLGQTRDVIHDDLNVLRSTIAVNHYDVNAVSNIGKHQIIEMPEQISPFPVVPVNQGDVFCREFNSRTEMMFKPENTTTDGDQFCLTGLPLRAGALCVGNSGDGICALLGRSFNITSITRSSSGTTFTYAVIFTTQFPLDAPSSDYLIIPFVSGNSDGSLSIDIQSKTSAGFSIRVRNAIVVPSVVQFIVLGG